MAILLNICAVCNVLLHVVSVCPLDWSPAHSDSNLALVENGVFPRNLNLALPQDVNSFAFSKFANVYFQVRVKQELPTPFIKKKILFIAHLVSSFKLCWMLLIS